MAAVTLKHTAAWVGTVCRRTSFPLRVGTVLQLQDELIFRPGALPSRPALPLGSRAPKTRTVFPIFFHSLHPFAFLLTFFICDLIQKLHFVVLVTGAGKRGVTGFVSGLLDVMCFTFIMTLFQMSLPPGGREQLYSVRFQVLTAARMRMTVFWDVAPCIW
jgi:hypothetical protein